MRKAIFMLYLAVVSGSAWAEWVEVGVSDTQTVYADPATIRKKGSMAKMWTLYDNKRPEVHENKPYMSLLVQEEYDCDDEQTRPLSMTFSPENMAKDRPISSGSVRGQWTPIAPRTMGEALWKFACGKL